MLRIWADGKLLYDKSGASPEVAKGGLRFRFHTGNETQLPDPLIEAHVGDGRAPAHRGLCYLVFEDLPLADFGNRIPNLTAEITFHREAAQPWQLLEFITSGEGGLLGSYQINELAIDWRRGHGWFLTGGSDPATAGLRRFDLRTMREDRQARMSHVTNVTPNGSPGTLFCGTDSPLDLPRYAASLTPASPEFPHSS